jgi:hypothetical protein
MTGMISDTDRNELFLSTVSTLDPLMTRPETATGLPVPRRSDLWRAIALGLFSCLVYLAMPQPAHPNAGDNLWYVPTAMSLVHHGDLDLSEFAGELRASDPADVWIDCLDADPRLLKLAGRPAGRGWVSHYPIGPALFSVPVVVVSDWALGRPRAPLARARQLAIVTAATSTALAVALMFCLIARLVEEQWLLWTVTLFYAFASPHFSTHHSELWSHNVLQVFMLMALLFLVAARGRVAWLGALPLAGAFLTRPDSMLFVLAYAALVLTMPGQRLAFFSVLGLALVGFMLWSHSLFGTYLPPYYHTLQTTGLRLYPSALLGTLVSPNRGVFVFTPVLVLCVPGALVAVSHRKSLHPIYALSAVVTVAYWIMFGTLPWWGGGFSVGPRYFTLVLPLMTVLLVPGLRRVAGLRGWARPVVRGLVAGAMVWSLFVQVRICVSSGPHEWNYEPNVDVHPEQLWNWSDLQILRRPRAQPLPDLPRVANCSTTP